MDSLRFSGHEKFQCRQYWLKKGYDFLSQGNDFTDDDSIVKLGVGKNMVASIKHWLKAFNIYEESGLTELGKFIFDEKGGVDPYLENPATIWLLHYHLVETRYASIYQIIFNDIKGEKIEFPENHIVARISRLLQEGKQKEVSPQTIKNDIDNFKKNYVRPYKISQVEDDLSTLLFELNLVVEIPTGKNQDRLFKIENRSRPELYKELVFYGILMQLIKVGSNTIPFSKVVNGEGSIGRIFALSSNGVMEKVEEIIESSQDLIYTSDGGIQNLTLRNPALKIDPLNILKPIYT